MIPQNHFLIALFMTVFSCGGVLAQQIDWVAKLEQGYQSDSQEPLIAFLDAWHADSKPYTPDIMNKKLPFEKDVYDIYFSFFRPGEEVYYNYSTHYVEVYDSTKYVILPNKITVVIVDSDMQEEFTLEPSERHFERVEKLIKTRTISQVVIEDFRPLVNTEAKNKKILYWRDKYIAALLGFLTQHENPYRLLKGGAYWEENAASQDRKKRLQYLNHPINIVPGHWGRGWIFETYPTVTRIYLSSNRKRAIIRYRTAYYLFGEALLEKVQKPYWEILSKKIYQVE